MPADPLTQACLLSSTCTIRLHLGILSTEYSIRFIRSGLRDITFDRDFDGTSTLFMSQSEDDVELRV
jgi:hypothetical protein